MGACFSRSVRSVVAPLAILLLVIAACGSSEQSESASTGDTTTTAVAPSTLPTTTTEPAPLESTTTTTEPDVDAAEPDPLAASKAARRELGEAFVEAFYSFDSGALEALFADGEATAALYYQGFAEGGNYRVFDRVPCVASITNEDEVLCPVTVEDDAMMALDTSYKVTDTFRLTVEDDLIVDMGVMTDDPPIIQDAVGWVFSTYPELMDGACSGMWFDGETPGDCSRAIVAGVREYADLEGITP